jgi:chromosomal replication initiation ATPase DnaA
MPGKTPDTRQGLLPFPAARPRYQDSTFIPDESNHEAMAWLENGWPLPALVVWGAAGSGKSHMLTVWAERNQAPVWRDGAIPALESVPERGPLVVDDADRVGDEVGLFHLLNLSRERGLILLMAARLPPSRWAVALPDLSSRLRAIPSVEVRQPSDAMIDALIRRHAAERQLEMPDAVVCWLVPRIERDAAAIEHVVAMLDGESLRQRKALTVPLASRVLNEAGQGAAEDVTNPAAER